MQKVFRDVLLFCPEAATGGPEALHQLAHAIRRHGGSARMVYYGGPSSFAFDGPVLRAEGGASPMLGTYARYHPEPLDAAVLGPDTLVVFPEVCTALAAVQPVPFRRAVWWLSVPNAFGANPLLADEAYARGFFADRTLLHFHQSDYARCLLVANGVPARQALSDYTDPDFVHRSRIAAANPPVAARDPVICYFPTKGGARAARFIETAPALQQVARFQPLRGMTKAEVADHLFGARIYLDFGDHPGKDRVPREAAVAGAVVLLHAAGAAMFHEDHPLPPEHLFTEADIESGALAARVAEVLADPAPHFAAQRIYRQSILQERERFDLEVRAAFFDGV